MHFAVTARKSIRLCKYKCALLSGRPKCFHCKMQIHLNIKHAAMVPGLYHDIGQTCVPQKSEMYGFSGMKINTGQITFIFAFEAFFPSLLLYLSIFSLHSLLHSSFKLVSNLCGLYILNKLRCPILYWNIWMLHNCFSGPIGRRCAFEKWCSILITVVCDKIGYCVVITWLDGKRPQNSLSGQK